MCRCGLASRPFVSRTAASRCPRTFSKRPTAPRSDGIARLRSKFSHFAEYARLRSSASRISVRNLHGFGIHNWSFHPSFRPFVHPLFRPFAGASAAFPSGSRSLASGIRPRTSVPQPLASGVHPRTPRTQPRTSGTQPRKSGISPRTLVFAPRKPVPPPLNPFSPCLFRQLILN